MNVSELAAHLVNIPSESGNEREIADFVEGRLRANPLLEVLRDGDAVLARTNGGKRTRVILAGHLDTVPIANNVPGTMAEGGVTLWGRGSVDMKSGCAVFLKVAEELVALPRMDITWIFYDHEEVAAELSGLGRVARHHPEWLHADLAVLGEPTNGQIEGGCNGTMRLNLVSRGKSAHSARPWMGENAVHALGEPLRRLEEWGPSVHTVGGLDFTESLLAVGISGGGARNSVPDEATLIVNFRFAPDRTQSDAEAYVRSLFEDVALDITVTDSAPAAEPGMDHPEFDRLSDLLREQGAGEPVAKLGWTDVARFSALGVPAINCGPGDALLSHRVDEACPVAQIENMYNVFTQWLETSEKMEL
ncbi:MAG: succinyl-diaminopimelate desuccinylase [Ancrocorticia sp.]|uniref:succinyl-diaminopimelate desuccinylase n=1 Tax=Ancrocorticia sp. TaxID=2593684 RepID=UPI003F904DA8